MAEAGARGSRVRVVVVAAEDGVQLAAFHGAHGRGAPRWLRRGHVRQQRRLLGVLLLRRLVPALIWLPLAALPAGRGPVASGILTRDPWLQGF